MFHPEYYDPLDPFALPSPGWPDIAAGPPEPDETPDPPDPPTPPTPEDPRTPIQKLLETFNLVEDEEARAQVALWNKEELPKNLREKARREHVAHEIERQISMGKVAGEEVQYAHELAFANSDSAEGIETTKRVAAVDCDADVHISESAILFPRWHQDAEWLETAPYRKASDSLVEPDEHRAPLLFAKPGRSIEDIERTGPDEKEPYTWTAECVRLARSMIPKVPVKRKGSKGAAPAGTLGWVIYPPRSTEGWMYVEPPDSDYGKWFQDRILKKYTDAKQKFEELSASDTATEDERMTARYYMRQAAACIAVANQEGAPSAINTYDGLVLSWGIGIAGPGKLPKTFHEIMKDRRVYKAFYLCGVHYDGFVMGSEHHGAYQIVDLESDAPAVVYKDQYDHGPKAKRYEFQGNAYKVLKYFTSQLELIHLLIQIAKDPLTRETVFAPNYQMIEGFVSFVQGEHVHTDALHIFIAQVKHNWGFGPGMVGWALSRFSDEEKRVHMAKDAPKTSTEKDQAIAKGIVRYLMGRLQQQRWQRAVKMLKLEAEGKLKDPTLSPRGKFLFQLPATTEFAFDRLIEGYWKPLARGPGAQTKRPELGTTGLKVDGFPEEISEPRRAGHYVWIQAQPKPPRADRPPPKYYDLGPLSQLDLLFPHEIIKFIGLEGGMVVIDDGTGPRKVPQELKPTAGGAR